jgi:HTH-type transcriptional regulator / antitoxin HipB
MAMDYTIRTLQQLRPLLIGLRKKAGLSQAALATQLGISQQSYAKIEANPASTSFERLHTIVRLLGGDISLRAPDEEIAAALAEQPTDQPRPAASVPASSRRRRGATEQTPGALTWFRPANKENW